ncbi:MAG TPA: hypothetical protein VMV62_02335 [Candidatus Paceibacterota bacterium]|nr:hypothetical protein [Candidatus Paceibacterota bacterium]
MHPKPKSSQFSISLSILAVGLVVIIGTLLLLNTLFPKKADAIVTDPNSLPGIETGDAPWSPEITDLRARLKDIGLPALPSEGTVLHIHQHLDLSIDGTPVSIPADIGDAEAQGFIAPVHTHDTSGIIHVESDTVRAFTLGEFFDIWGVRFTASCIGGYCADATHTLTVYANGTPVAGDPRDLVLKAREEIAVVYGSASSTPAVPSTYAFAPGY